MRERVDRRTRPAKLCRSHAGATRRPTRHVRPDEVISARSRSQSGIRRAASSVRQARRPGRDGPCPMSRCSLRRAPGAFSTVRRVGSTLRRAWPRRRPPRPTRSRPSEPEPFGRRDPTAPPPPTPARNEPLRGSNGGALRGDVCHRLDRFIDPPIGELVGIGVQFPGDASERRRREKFEQLPHSLNERTKVVRLEPVPL